MACTSVAISANSNPSSKNSPEAPTSAERCSCGALLPRHRHHTGPVPASDVVVGRYCPDIAIATGVRGSGAWVVGGFFGDRHVVGVALVSAGGGDPHEAGVLEVGERRRSGVAHAG